LIIHFQLNLSRFVNETTYPTHPSHQNVLKLSTEKWKSVEALGTGGLFGTMFFMYAFGLWFGAYLIASSTDQVRWRRLYPGVPRSISALESKI